MFSYILLLLSLPFYFTILKTTEGPLKLCILSLCRLTVSHRNITDTPCVSSRAFCLTGIKNAEFIYLPKHFLSFFLFRPNLMEVLELFCKTSVGLLGPCCPLHRWKWVRMGKSSEIILERDLEPRVNLCRKETHAVILFAELSLRTFYNRAPLVPAHISS